MAIACQPVAKVLGDLPALMIRQECGVWSLHDTDKHSLALAKGSFKAPRYIDYSMSQVGLSVRILIVPFVHDPGGADIRQDLGVEGVCDLDTAVAVRGRLGVRRQVGRLHLQTPSTLSARNRRAERPAMHDVAGLGRMVMVSCRSPRPRKRSSLRRIFSIASSNCRAYPSKPGMSGSLTPVRPQRGPVWVRWPGTRFAIRSGQAGRRPTPRRATSVGERPLPHVNRAATKINPTVSKWNQVKASHNIVCSMAISSQTHL
jgi:hypothetical protein